MPRHVAATDNQTCPCALYLIPLPLAVFSVCPYPKFDRLQVDSGVSGACWLGRRWDARPAIFFLAPSKASR